MGESVKTILIDWSVIQNREGFYASVLPQTNAPSWHGHNLDAINDSWVTGGVCSVGPPFNFVFCRFEDLSAGLKEFAETICEIAEDSVKENGGKVSYEG